MFDNKKKYFIFENIIIGLLILIILHIIFNRDTFITNNNPIKLNSVLKGIF